MKYPNKKRGVQPVIATVLLIAMVIVIGLIIFLWLRGFTQEAIVKFDKNVELVCGDIQFDSDYSGGSLTVSNFGNVAIYQMKLKILNGQDFETQNLNVLSAKWPEKGLNPGGVYSDFVSVSGDHIVVIPVLLGSSDSGEKTYACDESRFGQELTI